MSPNSNYPIKHTHHIVMGAPFLPSLLEFHKTREQQKAIVFNNNNNNNCSNQKINNSKLNDKELNKQSQGTNSHQLK